MNLAMPRDEFEHLPFRDDIAGDYIYDQYYRAKAHPNMVFKFIGTPQKPEWWVFKVDIELALPD